MPLTRYDIFAKQGKPPPDILRQDLPQELRVQICGIVDETVAEAGYRDNFSGSVGAVYGRLHYGLAHELGRTTLAGSSSDDRRCVQTFIMGDSSEHVLSLLDVLFQLLARDAVSAHPHRRHAIAAAAVAAKQELNRRFREHGAGYSIENSGVVKVTSTHLHKEVVKPALAVLHASDLAGADAEFRRAHEHHRHARHEEAITDCLKALESTLKVICTRRGWPFDDQKDTASRLIDIVFNQGLVPDQMKSEFSALRAVLESGVPTIRNRSGGHGAGVKPRVVPESLTAYALHLTAATILFLAELEKGR